MARTMRTTARATARHVGVDDGEDGDAATVRKVEMMARTRRDVRVDGGEDVDTVGNVGDSEVGDCASRADDGAGDGVSRRRGRRRDGADEEGRGCGRR